MTRRLLVALLSAIATSLALFSAPLAASADEDTNAVGECLGADQVWLLVVDEESNVIANECVGNPATGTEALENAGLTLGYDSSNFLCTIDSHPSQCPTTFNGQYWNYYSGTPGADYTYSTVGAGESSPAGGSIEAWCYNKADEESCTPPTLKIVQGGTEVQPASGTAQDLPVTGAAAATASPAATDEAPAEESSNLMGWVIAGIAVIAVGAGLIAWRVGANKKNGALGGR